MNAVMLPDAELIRNAILDCLMTNEEVGKIEPDDMAAIRNGSSDTAALLDKYSIKAVEAVVCKFGLHKDRLEKYRPMVVDCIKNLDPVFSHMGGSFLVLCMDRASRQWGEHRNCDELVALAVGLGICEFMVPRALWGSLSGGVPIVRFILPKEEVVP